MPCGPVEPRPMRRSASENDSDIFGLSGGTEVFGAMTGLALIWAAPWRAAMVLADEALREGLSRD